MIYLSTILFASAAVLGITIIFKWLQEIQASQTVIYAHGTAAAAALLLLAYYSLQNTGNFPKYSLILFVVAALGGFVLFFADKFAGRRIVPLGVLHALIAVAGFVMLLLFVFA